MIMGRQPMRHFIDKVLCCAFLHNLLLHESYPEEWLNGDEDDECMKIIF
jgi:hypothetical protein